MSSFISVFLLVRSLSVHLQLSPSASPDFTLIILNSQYLEMREFEYDERAFVDFYTEDPPCTQAISVLVYIGSSNKSKNQYYLGPAPLEDMARWALQSVEEPPRCCKDQKSICQLVNVSVSETRTFCSLQYKIVYCIHIFIVDVTVKLQRLLVQQVQTMSTCFGSKNLYIRLVRYSPSFLQSYYWIIKTCSALCPFFIWQCFWVDFLHFGCICCRLCWWAHHWACWRSS